MSTDKVSCTDTSTPGRAAAADLDAALGDIIQSLSNSEMKLFLGHKSAHGACTKKSPSKKSRFKAKCAESCKAQFPLVDDIFLHTNGPEMLLDETFKNISNEGGDMYMHTVGEIDLDTLSSVSDGSCYSPPSFSLKTGKLHNECQRMNMNDDSYSRSSRHSSSRRSTDTRNPLSHVF